MQKAKSRLKEDLELTPSENLIQPLIGNKNNRKKLIIRYLRQLHTFVLGIFFYFLIYVVLTKVEPTYFKNFPLTNTYLPLLILFFLGNFFTLSFLFLNSKQGLFLSLFGGIIFFLKIQDIVFDWSLNLSLILVILIWGLITLALRRYAQKHN